MSLAEVHEFPEDPTHKVRAKVKAEMESQGSFTASDVAYALWNDLDIAEQLAVGRQMFPQFVRFVISSHRQSVPKPGATVSLKWEGIKAARAAGLLDSHFNTGASYVRLADATKEDVEAIGHEYHRRESENAAWAEGFNRLHALMKRKRVKVVADLPADEVEVAIYG